MKANEGSPDRAIRVIAGNRLDQPRFHRAANAMGLDRLDSARDRACRLVPALRGARFLDGAGSGSARTTDFARRSLNGRPVKTPRGGVPFCPP